VIHVFEAIYIMLKQTSHRQTSDSAVLEIHTRDLESLRKSGTVTEKAILDAIDHSSRQLNSAVTNLANRLTLQSDQDKLAAVHTWQALNQSDVSEFIGGVSSQTCQQRFKRAADLVLSDLYFNQLHDRYAKIPEAHIKTYEWIFGASSPDLRYASFRDWLEELGSSQSVYWIAGKPGSGKSTLMRYIYDTPKTARYLRSWQGQDRLLFARVFFWNPGTTLQKSLTGLLRSLLNQLLSKADEMIQRAVPARWRAADLATEFGLKMDDWKEPWSEAEMLTALRNFVQESRGVFKTFFLIDGLDEFDGNDSQRLAVINLLKELSGSGTAKVCVSSRPWLIFQDEFENSPQLKLENLTRLDIQMYVVDLLGNNKRFCAMRNHAEDECNELVAEISEKAQGVFLWVHLVVRAIFEDLRDGNDLCDLQRTLLSLPSDLEDYFEHLLTTLDDKYRLEAAKLFRLVLYSSLVTHSHEPITLMTTSFVNERDQDFAIKMEPKAVSDAALEGRLEAAVRRLNSRCKGLLEVSDPRSGGYCLAHRVDFLHRTVKDFLMTKDMTAMINSYRAEGDDEGLFLAHAILAQIKMISLQDGSYGKSSGSNDFVALVEQALELTRDVENRLEHDSGPIVNELGCMISILNSSFGKRFDPTRGVPEWWLHWRAWNNPVLRLAIRSNLSKYVMNNINPGIVESHHGRPLLDCALRRSWLRPDFTTPPHPDVVKALLDAGGSPAETFDHFSIWAYFVGDIQLLGETSQVLSSKTYFDWLECTELLIDRGVCEVDSAPPPRSDGILHRQVASVLDVVDSFFAPPDATRLKEALTRNSRKAPIFGKCIDFVIWSYSRVKEITLAK
jgi:hypothetical protein